MYIKSLINYNNIYCVSEFDDEYDNLFRRNIGNRNRARQKLAKNLRILDSELDKAVILHPHIFEVVQGTPLFAIRHPSVLNDHVIFAFADGNGKVILLYSFLEKSSADYKRAIAVASHRLAEMEENHD